jgi:hypothetical protein
LVRWKVSQSRKSIVYSLFLFSYTPELRDPIAAMLAALQPHSIVFNGNGLTVNSVRWVGNEWGHAPDPNWSTGTSNDGGDPNSTIFCPAECDTTLQMFDRWFWVGTEIETIND